MKKSFVTINSEELITQINLGTILKINKNSTKLKQKLMMFNSKELKSISIKEYQKNKHKYVLVDESRFVETINLVIN
ncbi:hypothetical protein LJB88_04975 [Erysipelotrichaceae bacterium OttesenSCG-928-M19]|nr:hypothetical protein [Erysipelotrichaceae bacterium OttesenSCG-928-M19]